MKLFLHLVDINHHDQFSYVQLARVLRDVGDVRFANLFAETDGRPIIYDIDRIKGAVYFQVGDLSKAKEHLNRLLADFPHDLAATYYQGAIAMQEGDLDKAEQLLTEVIEREKSYFFAYTELLDLYEKRGDKEKAETYFKLAWKYNPANNIEGICCGLPLTEKQKKL